MNEEKHSDHEPEMIRSQLKTAERASKSIKKHTRNLEYVITFQNLLVDAKMQIVKKLNSVKGLTDTFIKTSNGFKVTNPEGYVAIKKGGAVKLVDRLEFSRANFTAAKDWVKG